MSLTKKYSEASGSTAVLDSNIEMYLNEFGLYEERLLGSKKELSPKFILVSPNLNDQTDEPAIAKELYGNSRNISFDSRLGYFHSLFVGHVKEKIIEKSQFRRIWYLNFERTPRTRLD